MNRKPLISIIMNCYNGGQYLEESINSVINQTYKNWELIFWDNLSTDNSFKIFEKFKDKRLKYFCSKMHNVLYDARNLAIQKAQGDFIAFLDTDDIWLSDKIEKQLPKFDDPKVGLVYGNFWILNKKKIIKKKIFSKKKLEKGSITQSLLKNYKVGLLTIIIRKSFLINFDRVFDSSYDSIADFDFVIKFSLKHKLDYVQEPVAIYREHEAQLSKKLFNTQIEQFKHWLISIESNQETSFLNIKFIKNKIKYMEVVKLIYEKKWLKSLSMINNYPLSLNKIKLIIILILPKNILKFFRN